MYLVGAPHPNRDLLDQHLRSHPNESYVTSAEVYQEIIHRYVAIRRWQAIDDAFRFLDALVEETFTITREDVARAHRIALQQHRLSGRDSLHLAVMDGRGIQTILTLDHDFDSWPQVHRLP